MLSNILIFSLFLTTPVVHYFSWGFAERPEGLLLAAKTFNLQSICWSLWKKGMKIVACISSTNSLLRAFHCLMLLLHLHFVHIFNITLHFCKAINMFNIFLHFLSISLVMMIFYNHMKPSLIFILPTSFQYHVQEEEEEEFVFPWLMLVQK